MSTGGLSGTRLGRMHDVMVGHVERGDVPGVVTLVSRRGEVHVDAIGTTAVGGEDPMRRDTIFRIASMTKPVATVAAMILVEECRLRLDEPVAPWLPELADRQVLKRLDGALDDTVPANRPITVRDLLTLRMGFGYILDSSGEYPVELAASERHVYDASDPWVAQEPDTWIRELGALPLMYQPGETWMYDTGFHALGVLISRAAKQPLDVFLRDRIFEPLGMHDTGYQVPATKLDRLASSYRADSETGALELVDAAADSLWARPPAFPSAADGLFSTVDDYLAFGRMLMDKGRCGDGRILSRPSVELITTDQLSAGQRAAGELLLDGRGWGFGVAVVVRRDGVSSVPGRYGWEGGDGTSWSSDPHEEMVAILMTQVQGFPAGIYDHFWTSAYAAIDD